MDENDAYHNEPQELLTRLGVSERMVAKWAEAHPDATVGVPARVLAHHLYHAHSAHFGSTDLKHRGCFAEVAGALERALVEHAAIAIRTTR